MFKTFFIGFCLVATGYALAADNNDATAPQANGRAAQGKAGQDFEKVQKRLLDAVDKRIQTLEDVRDCIAAATDMPSLRECKPANGGKDAAK
jgi:hypothetical protein